MFLAALDCCSRLHSSACFSNCSFSTSSSLVRWYTGSYPKRADISHWNVSTHLPEWSSHSLAWQLPSKFPRSILHSDEHLSLPHCGLLDYSTVQSGGWVLAANRNIQAPSHTLMRQPVLLNMHKYTAMWHGRQQKSHTYILQCSTLSLLCLLELLQTIYQKW
jgi:hypothetical protein